MKRTNLTTIFLVFIAMLLTSVVNAKSVRVRVLDSDLSKLPFGGDTASALNWVDAKVKASFGPRLKAALDRSERAGVMKETEAKMTQVRKSLVEFKRQKTGLENSVLSGEFVHGAGESLLRYQEGNIDHYLLFSGGKLWKYIRALKAKGDFNMRVKKHSRDFGAPTGVKSNKQGITEATWAGDKLVLTIRNLRNIYGTDLLLVINKKMRTVAEQKRKDTAQDSGPAIDPELQGILED